MKGFVTWIGVIGLLLSGIYQIFNDNTEQGIALIATALGYLGIGRKIEKTK